MLIPIWILHRKVKQVVEQFQSRKFYLFIPSLKVRVDEYVCTDSTNQILIILRYYVTRNLPMVNKPGNLLNIPAYLGMITLKDITKYEHTYVNQTIRISRYEQLLFEFLMNIIS